MIKKQKAKTDLTDRSLYRRLVSPGGLVSFSLTVKETDLLILAEKDLQEEARELVLNCRHRIEEYIARNGDFRDSLVPLAADPAAPAIVRAMMEAGRAATVGPMAAVAGAVAESVGRGLGELSGQVVVENGGDIFLRGGPERSVSLYTGEEGLGAGLGFRVFPGEGVGIGTSSGRFGHSLSFGEASTATILSPSAAVADAAATAVGNIVRGKDGIEKGLERARAIPGVTGALIVQEGKLGAWGDLELTDLEERGPGP